MVRALNVKRLRVTAWVGWPLLLIVAGTGLLYVMRYRLGWGIYWVWSPLHLLQALLVMLGPPLVFEVLVRRGRNNG